MLEFKNVSVALEEGRVSTPFSLELQAGEVSCLVGGERTGKSRVLLAVMGLVPLSSGYITVDGELVTPGSSAYFRRMMAYVPQRLPDGHLQVGQFLQEVLSVKINVVHRPTKEQLLGSWESLGLSPDVYDKWIDEVDPEALKLAMLSALPFLHRPIILVDDPVETDAVQDFLLNLAKDGAEVLCAMRDEGMQCHARIEL